MSFMVTVNQWVPACLLLLNSLFGIYALHVFSLRNGVFDLFFKAVNTRRLPDGKPFMAVDTRGRIPSFDRQICAFATFMLTFTDNLASPDTTLSGMLFTGAWGPAWLLIVLESLRAANQGHFLSYLFIPGYIIFHYSHAFGTPLYLALHLFFSPSATPAAQTAKDLLIEAHHLLSIPISFFLGYIVPLVIMALPTPNVITKKFKHTVTGWYQQWHVIIAFFHYSTLWLVSLWNRRTQNVENHEQRIIWFRVVYAFAFLLAAVPYLTVTCLSMCSYIAPSLFNDKKRASLHPQSILVPTKPWSGRKASSMQEGFKWLIQWDYIIGTIGTFVWTFTLRMSAARAVGIKEGLLPLIFRILGYLFLGGPVAVTVGLMWERDEMVFRGS